LCCFHALAAQQLPETLPRPPYLLPPQWLRALALQAYSGERFYAENMRDDSQRVDQLFLVGSSSLPID
jgi:hypothetical protein